MRSPSGVRLTREAGIAIGGTIPVVSLLQETLGIPTVLMGFALPDDRMHAPNEKFDLRNFYTGIRTSIWFLANLGGGRQRVTTALRG